MIVIWSCNSSDSVDLDTCTTQLFFVSSAVCSQSNNDAAVRNRQGSVFIVKDFFDHVNRVDATVDLTFAANFVQILDRGDGSSCESLIDAPVVAIVCIDL